MNLQPGQYTGPSTLTSQYPQRQTYDDPRIFETGHPQAAHNLPDTSPNGRVYGTRWVLTPYQLGHNPDSNPVPTFVLPDAMPNQQPYPVPNGRGNLGQTPQMYAMNGIMQSSIQPAYQHPPVQFPTSVPIDNTGGQFTNRQPTGLSTTVLRGRAAGIPVHVFSTPAYPHPYSAYPSVITPRNQPMPVTVPPYPAAADARPGSAQANLPMHPFIPRTATMPTSDPRQTTATANTAIRPESAPPQQQRPVADWSYGQLQNEQYARQPTQLVASRVAQSRPASNLTQGPYDPVEQVAHGLHDISISNRPQIPTTSYHAGPGERAAYVQNFSQPAFQDAYRPLPRVPQPVYVVQSSPNSLRLDRLPTVPVEARPVQSMSPARVFAALQPEPEAPMSRRPASYSTAQQQASIPVQNSQPILSVFEDTPGVSPNRTQQGANQVQAPIPAIAAPPQGPAIPKLMLDDNTLTDEDPDSSATSITFSVVPPNHATKPQSVYTPKVTEIIDRRDEPRYQPGDTVTPRSLAQELTCAHCRLPINGRTVSAMGVRWHPDCFRCTKCGTGLEHVAFYEHDGKPYCHVDFQEDFARRCYQCKTPIEDESFITLDDPVLGKRDYHELHFYCSECGDPFIDPKSLGKDKSGPTAKPFVVVEGYPFCERCNVSLYRAKCKACQQPIGDDVVRALNADWHEACFTCARCQQPLEDAFFLSSKGDRPHCVECYRIRVIADL